MSLTTENIVMLALVSCQFQNITTIAAFCENYGLHRQEVAACIFDLWQAGILKMRGEGIDRVQYALRKRFAGEVQKLAAQEAEQPKPAVEETAGNPANHEEDVFAKFAARVEAIKEPILKLMTDGKSRDAIAVAHDLKFADPMSRFATKKALNQLSRKDGPLIRKKGKVFSRRPQAKIERPQATFKPVGPDLRELDYLSVMKRQSRSEFMDKAPYMGNAGNWDYRLGSASTRNRYFLYPHLTARHVSLIDIVEGKDGKRVVLKGQLELTLSEAEELKTDLLRNRLYGFSGLQQFGRASLIKETTTIKHVVFSTNELASISSYLNAVALV